MGDATEPARREAEDGGGLVGAARRRRSWRARLLFAPLPALILTGGLELGFRLSPHNVSVRGSTPAGLFVGDPDLGWRLNPDHAEVNGLGLHDGPYRADADVKLLLLGDSVSCAEHLPMEVTYPSLLERDLERADPSRSHEVINAGVSGYSTFQQLRYLELRGAALEPDLVVLQFCLNDVVERYVTLAEYGGESFFLGVDTRPMARGVYGWFVRHSVAFEVLSRAARQRATNREEYEVTRLARDEVGPKLEEAWALSLQELDGIQAACARRGLPLVLVVTPYAFQLERPLALRQPQDRLLAWAARRGVPCVDLLPAFAANQRPWPFLDANHFNPAGHALAARVIGEALRDHPALRPGGG